MKNSRIRITAAAAVAVVAGAALAGCSSGTSNNSAGGSQSALCKSGKGTIGYIPKLGTDPYMVTVHKAAEAAAAKTGGHVIYASPSQATGAAQIPFVDQMIVDKVCVIAISGSDLNSTSAALARAKAAGIKVLSWDSDIAASSRSVFVNQAPTAQLGAYMLQSMQKLLGPSGGDFAILSSTPTATNQNAWIAAMKTQLATNPSMKNMHLVAVGYGQEEANTNAQEAAALVQTYPKLKGMIIPAGIGYPAAAQALSQIGALGRIKLTGLAPSSLIKNYIASGNATDVWWNVTNLGTLSYYAAQALAEGKITGAAGQTFTAGSLGTFTIGADGQVLLGNADIVTAANVNAFPF
jgi:rhamnose transport system substrate-binding protein